MDWTILTTFKIVDSTRSNSSRELSAIFFADIVGYTAMMERDEEMALALLNKYQNTLKEKLDIYQGKLIKNYGDGSLCLFGSVLNALKCAEDVQIKLNNDPKVPLRIGLHLGDVTHIEGDAYSSDINLASRIESLGIPGSVLCSHDFYEKVKNQKEFRFSTLGKFHFKNVSLEQEVYALANDGMVIPSREEISGKIEQKKDKIPIKWIVATSLLILAGIFGYLNLGKSSNPLSKEVREKRIAILEFQNQTMDPDMGVYGSMIADWLTKGLMETGEANIINSSNIQEQIEKSNPGQSPNPDFATLTGVDIIVEGRYYISEANIFIVAHFIDVNTGKILHFVQIDADRGKYMDLLKEVSDEITSYWAVKDDVQLSLSPPDFEAYTEWIEGEQIYTTSAIDAIEKYENAFLKDTSFYPPLFRLFSLYSNTGNSERMEEIFNYLQERKSSFTKYEKLEFEQKKYFLENNYLAGARVSEQKYYMDPSDYKANYNAGFLNALSRNYDKALEILNHFDHRYLKDVGLQKEWRLSVMAHAHFQKGEYEKVIQLARDNPEAKYFTPYVAHQLMSLVRLDSLEALDKAFEKYSIEGTREPSGQLTPHNQLLILICCELLITGKTQQLLQYSDKLEEWMANNKIEEFPHTIPDIFNNLPFREEEVRGYISFFRKDYQDAIAHWRAESIPDSNWPDKLERASRLGVSHAYSNDIDRAMDQINYINELKVEDRNLEYSRDYYKARVYAALDRKSEAISLIREASNNGFIFFRPYVMERDPFLTPIISDNDFLEIVAPK